MQTNVYDNQKKAAKQIFEHYNSVHTENYPPVLLVAQPQSGKTDAVICALEVIIKNNTKKYGVDKFTTVFWMGPSDVNLKEQTFERISNSSQLLVRNLLNGQIYHMPDLLSNNNSKESLLKSYSDAKKRGDKIIVVLDEAHIGIGLNQTIPEFFKERLGFFPGFHDSKENVFTIIVTATPGSYLNFANNNKTNVENSFRYVYLQPGADYNSFKLMKENGRLRESFPVKNDADWYTFFYREFLPFLQGESGYYIARVTSKNDFLCKKLKEICDIYKLQINVYHSDLDNISNLDEDLKTKPKKHTFCLIVASYLQGKTFNNMEYVRGWFDRNNKNTTHTFMAQSAGRNCGYNGRTTYNYPISINAELIDETIKFYDLADQGEWRQLEEDFILNNTHTKIVKSSGRQTNSAIHWGQPMFFTCLPEAKKYAEEKYKKDYRVAYVKGNDYIDLAAQIDNNIKSPNLGRAPGKREKDAIIVDFSKPSEKYKASHKLLKKRFPHHEVALYPRISNVKQTIKNKDVYSKPFSHRKGQKL